MGEVEAVIARYRWFIDNEVAGSSDTYRDWAEGVVADAEVCARLSLLPVPKQQPHLLFAAARFCGAPIAGYDTFGPWLRDRWDDVVRVVLARATQTNEAARCGALLPVLSSIDGPIALIEVGASAGLCLIPDKYSYRYRAPGGSLSLLDGDPRAPLIACRITGAVPPTRLPDIVWRAGVDLNPLDASNPDDTRWLELLVWPEHQERRERIRAALAVVAREPVRIVAGDLVETLPRLAAEAPREATLVVMHTAVLNYLTPEHRARAIRVIRETGARWVSQEGISVIDGIRKRLPADIGTPPRYVLALDGAPVALTGFHGGYYEALQPR